MAMHMIGYGAKKEDRVGSQVSEIELGIDVIELLKVIYEKNLGKCIPEVINYMQHDRQIKNFLIFDRTCYFIRKIFRDKNILKVKYDFIDKNIPSTPYLEKDEGEYFFFNELVMILVSIITGKIVNFDKEKNDR